MSNSTDDLEKKLSKTWAEINQWMIDNAPIGWEPEDVRDFFVYYGYSNFIELNHRNPDISLEKAHAFIFGSTDEKNSAELSIQGLLTH